MPQNDEGEFELVLGNRQLISVFLIVVVLLGVFFSMGYIVGRNSPAAAAEAAKNEKPVAERTAEPADSPAADTPAEPSQASSTPSAASDPTPPSHPPPIAKTPQVKPKPSPVSPTPDSRTPAERVSERASVAGDPPGGQYWQVVATARPDAEIVAEALGKKGFHAVVAPAPVTGIFRVLVGPTADTSMLAQVRTNLESAGFKNPILRKY